MMRRELPLFLVAGVLAVLTDFSVYRSFAWAGVDIHAAKAAGFLAGTVFAYFANRRWTFGHTRPAQRSAWRFSLVYSLTLAVNVHVNAAVLAILDGRMGAIQLAFLIATATSAAMNFLGMKFFVFKSAHSPEAA